MLTLLITLIVIGLLWYLVENYLPMPDPMKAIIRVVVIILLILYLARWFGIV